ncbi:hypothetical protein JK358_26360 [Nocardia sp. 2]|uniref:Uncharacterized protein n=1 Tax=Nocardia acididurans TaxID=2802282 RepID=A0ABS1MFF8_9NOCA|nr:hypothetical protein [Nocardia acididurans]MBL1077933.1 hypothetical protein [Nocardia acididurans]
MPKRISDVSLHVFGTPQTLDRVVRTVCRVVDEYVADRDIFAWRFTLPVEVDDPAHTVLETQWRLDHPTVDPGERRTYEIALSLVGESRQLTKAGIARLEQRLVLELCADEPIPYIVHALQRENFELEENRELI